MYRIFSYNHYDKFDIYDFGIIVIVILLLIFFGIFIGYLVTYLEDSRKRKLTKYVEENSIILKQLSILNQDFDFYDVAPEFTYVKTCSSTTTFRFANIDKFILDIIQNDADYFIFQINRADFNKNMLCSYQNKISPLFDMISSENWQGLSLKKQYQCEKIEKELFKSYTLMPTTEIKIRIIKEYTSPMGQNHYEEEFVYSQNNVLNFLERVKEIEKNRDTSRYQRSLLTPSMRYDVLKRDSFRCTICGSTANDGASLEVDHIIPVSKGGKTEPSNLRTLCHNCNAGKSDKYDPQGTN